MLKQPAPAIHAVRRPNVLNEPPRHGFGAAAFQQLAQMGKPFGKDSIVIADKDHIIAACRPQAVLEIRPHRASFRSPGVKQARLFPRRDDIRRIVTAAVIGNYDLQVGVADGQRRVQAAGEVSGAFTGRDDKADTHDWPKFRISIGIPSTVKRPTLHPAGDRMQGKPILWGPGSGRGCPTRMPRALHDLVFPAAFRLW